MDKKKVVVKIKRRTEFSSNDSNIPSGGEVPQTASNDANISLRLKKK